MQQTLRCSVVNLIAAKKNIMYFKFDRELEGADVEVYDHNGNVIAHHTLQKHKLIIDFINAEPGNLRRSSYERQ